MTRWGAYTKDRTLPLQEKGIKPCIPGRKSRNEPIKYDKRRYPRRNRIEIMFGRLKDWRRVATRYDRCPTVFFSAIALAATVIFWLCSTSPDPSASTTLFSHLHRLLATSCGLGRARCGCFCDLSPASLRGAQLIGIGRRTLHPTCESGAPSRPTFILSDVPRTFLVPPATDRRVCPALRRKRTSNFRPPGGRGDIVWVLRWHPPRHPDRSDSAPALRRADLRTSGSGRRGRHAHALPNLERRYSRRAA